MVGNTLLLADNEAGFREVWGKVLSYAGYNIKLASNPKQARSLLREKDIDVAILDLRLVDDNDDEDRSGLDIAMLKTFRYIPKIILTGFPTSYENSRKALGFTLDGLPPAIAFVDKAEGPKALLEVIRQALKIWPRLRMLTARVSEQIKADQGG